MKYKLFLFLIVVTVSCYQQKTIKKNKNISILIANAFEEPISSTCIKMRFNNSEYFIDTNGCIDNKFIIKSKYYYEKDFDEHQIILLFSSEGKKRFSKITGEHKKKKMAVIIDNKIVSMPIVYEKINSKMAVIRGNFSKKEAKALNDKINNY